MTAHLGLGNAYYEIGEPERALFYYHKVNFEEGQEMDDVLYNMGNAYYSLGDNEKAMDYYHKCIKINPEKIECLYNLGNAYVKKQEYLSAV